jgi:hypothetical protein
MVGVYQRNQLQGLQPVARIVRPCRLTIASRSLLSIFFA